jgi:hypothetical protein
LELHTFTSLSQKKEPQYTDTMRKNCLKIVKVPIKFAKDFVKITNILIVNILERCQT